VTVGLSDPFYLPLSALETGLERLARAHGERVRDVIDIGAGDKPYQHLFADANYIGTDTRPLPDSIMASADALPFPDGSFDVALSTQVLEHVIDPDAAVAEMARVLRPNGYAFVSVPSTWPYHPSPGDYWRWTADGLTILLERNGLHVVEVAPLRGTGACLVTIGAFYLNVVVAHIRLPRLLSAPLFAAVNLTGILIDPPTRSLAYGSMSANHLAVATRLPRA
jgi:SAM-dependent methyltransferase